MLPIKRLLCLELARRSTKQGPESLLAAEVSTKTNLYISICTTFCCELEPGEMAPGKTLFCWSLKTGAFHSVACKMKDYRSKNETQI